MGIWYRSRPTLHSHLPSLVLNSTHQLPRIHPMTYLHVSPAGHFIFSFLQVLRLPPQVLEKKASRHFPTHPDTLSQRPQVLLFMGEARKREEEIQGRQQSSDKGEQWGQRKKGGTCPWIIFPLWHFHWFSHHAAITKEETVPISFTSGPPSKTMLDTYLTINVCWKMNTVQQSQALTKIEKDTFCLKYIFLPAIMIIVTRCIAFSWKEAQSGI